MRKLRLRCEWSWDLNLRVHTLVHQDFSLGGQRNVDISVVWGSARGDFRYTKLEFPLRFLEKRQICNLGDVI